MTGLQLKINTINNLMRIFIRVYYYNLNQIGTLAAFKWALEYGVDGICLDYDRKCFEKWSISRSYNSRRKLFDSKKKVKIRWHLFLDKHKNQIQNENGEKIETIYNSGYISLSFNNWLNEWHVKILENCCRYYGIDFVKFYGINFNGNVR